MTKFAKYFGAVVSVGMLAATFAPVHADDNIMGMPTARAATRPVATLDLACVASAVDKRDTAVDNAWNTYSAAISSALTTRRDALKAAWVLTDVTARRTAVKAAWTSYSAAHRTAWNTWTAARRAAWKQFATDRKACGVKTSTTDEGQGQDSSL